MISPLSTFVFNFNMRHYTTVLYGVAWAATVGGVGEALLTSCEAM